MEEITIDIDVPYDKFIRSNQFAVIKCRLERDVPFVESRYIRRSCRDNVHLRINFSTSLTFLDAILTRAYLDDDPARLACDLSRYYRSHKLEDTGRCFDVKYVNGSLCRAGEWERF